MCSTDKAAGLLGKVVGNGTGSGMAVMFLCTIYTLGIMFLVLLITHGLIYQLTPRMQLTLTSKMQAEEDVLVAINQSEFVTEAVTKALPLSKI